MSAQATGRLRAALIFSLLTAALAAPLLVAPGDLPDLGLCLFHRGTGLPCPACGLTHAFLAAGRADWAASFAWHPLGVPAHLGALFLWLAAGGALAGGRPLPGLRPRQALLAAAALLLVWIVTLAEGARPGR